jgi:hypothetical protein
MAGDSWPRSSETAMVDWTKIPHIDWALQLNQDMRQMLDSNFPNRHGNWSYVNELVAFLRSKHVAGIWEKIADANHLEKFYSVVSELGFARDVNLGGGVSRLVFLGLSQTPRRAPLSHGFGSCFLRASFQR